MEHFLMILSLIIACIVLVQQFMIIHKQNVQGKVYERNLEGFFAAIKIIKTNIDDMKSDFIIHQSKVIEETIEQCAFRNRYYKRKNKTEAAQPGIGHPSTDQEVSNVSGN